MKPTDELAGSAGSDPKCGAEMGQWGCSSACDRGHWHSSANPCSYELAPTTGEKLDQIAFGPFAAFIGRETYFLAVAQPVGFGPRGQKCFIFHWGLTDTLSATALFSFVSDRSNRQQNSE